MELVGHGACERGAVVLGNQVQHHVHRRRAAGTRQPVAVDLVQLIGAFQVRERLAEAEDVFPVNGTAIAGEHAGTGQQVRAGGERADGDTAGRRLSDGREVAPLLGLLAGKAGADQEVVGALEGLAQRHGLQ
jgi:hypothetical protein